MCGSTCFGRLSAHHQERTTALGVSGFTFGAWRLERCWSWPGRLCVMRKLRSAPDDGRRGSQNMLSHTLTSSNKLVELLHLVGWLISIVWWCTDLPTSNPNNIWWQLQIIELLIMRFYPFYLCFMLLSTKHSAQHMDIRTSQFVFLPQHKEMDDTQWK